MKLIKLLLVAVCMSVPFTASAQSNEELNKKIEKLSKIIEAQQKQIDSLKGSSSEAISDIVKKEVEAALKKGGSGSSLLKLGKAESLKISGDVRIRYEARDRESSGSKNSRDRFRQRVRVGFSWELKNNWSIG